MSTYILHNIVPWGFSLLLLYIFIDIFLDFFRKPRMSHTKRIILYSFTRVDLTKIRGVCLT